MKRAIRTVIAIALLLVYVGCQKEITGVLPENPPTPTDSTTTPTDSTGTDSTITTPPDSLTIVSFNPDSGRIGTQIIITGTGFAVTTNSLVFINNTAAKVVSTTTTELTVQVLEGTTTGKISVTANGKTATSLTDFVVLKDSVPADSTVTNKNVWTRKADFPPGSAVFVNGFSVGGNGYFFRGKTLWQYNPTTNKWSQKKTLPSKTSRRFGFCFVIGSKTYVGLGANQEGEYFYDASNSSTYNYKEVWEYDAVQDKWTQKADFPGVARVVPFSFVVNGTGYMGGGDTTNANSSSTHDFWKYEPATDKWTQLNDFPAVDPIGFSGFSLAGAGYVLEAGPGNPTAPTSGPYSNVLWKYNTATDTWERKASLPNADFVSAVTFTIAEKAYVALGVASNNPNNTSAERADFWMYDPALNQWTKKADAGGGVRWLGSGFAIGGKGYVGLGTGSIEDNVKSDFWEYTPE